MTVEYVLFSPITRLSGLLSAELFVSGGRVVEANVQGTTWRGFEWMMRDRDARDAVYLTQRICGICSLAHGACASYLLDGLYHEEIPENAQYLRNLMYGADFLQNHIRHFYVFSLPDFVRMPARHPFLGQSLVDLRLLPKENERLVEHYTPAIKASQASHQLLAIFGGKAPHQHSFVHGGVAVAPTADKVAQARSLLRETKAFVASCMIPDAELIARRYADYYGLGETSRRFLSWGLWRFGPKNETTLWKPGVLDEGTLEVPDPALVEVDVARSWFHPGDDPDELLQPDPQKTGGYTFVKSVTYGGRHYQVGPLARGLVNGWYRGGTSTMDRIVARTLETQAIAGLMEEWLDRLEEGPPPISQRKERVSGEATSVTDSMRGALMHRATVSHGLVERYSIVTPTMWNFSPKDSHGRRGPAEEALVGLRANSEEGLLTSAGRVIRSFDPCMTCATHVLKGGAAFPSESLSD